MLASEKQKAVWRPCLRSNTGTGSSWPFLSLAPKFSVCSLFAHSVCRSFKPKTPYLPRQTRRGCHLGEPSDLDPPLRCDQGTAGFWRRSTKRSSIGCRPTEGFRLGWRRGRLWSTVQNRAGRSNSGRSFVSGGEKRSHLATPMCRS